jgi:hypothetical protein
MDDQRKIRREIQKQQSAGREVAAKMLAGPEDPQPIDLNHPDDKRREKPATPREVAEWMVERLNEKPHLQLSGLEGPDLYQEQIIHRIRKIFGDEHVYTNQSGNLSIARPVLKEFAALTPNVVWVRSEKLWRTRAPGDKSGRMQD